MYKIEKDMPIGVFDSGLGGLSVLKQCLKVMPHEKFIYYGDSKNAPYGTKSIEEVRALSETVVEKLMEMRVKGILVACNTATSAVIRNLREEHPEFPVVGIEPAVKPAALEHPGSRVLVMATPRTLKDEKFKYLKERFDHLADIVKVPCGGLMEYVEDGILSGAEVEDYIRQMLSGYMTDKVEAVVLGCTHYPFLRDTIQAIVGERVQIYDGAFGTAREMKRRLQEAGALTDSKKDTEITVLNSATEEVMTVLIDEGGRPVAFEPSDIHLKRTLAMLGMKC